MAIATMTLKTKQKSEDIAAKNKNNFCVSE